MMANKLSDTRIQVLTGNVLLEVGELLPDNSITLLYKKQVISARKSGLYRIDAEAGTLRVYNGEATVSDNGATFTVKQAKLVNLNSAVLTAEKFDNKVGDEFYRWASRRASYLSVANVAAAKSMHSLGYSGSVSQWAWNPWYGMFTYVPYRGWYNSPFGYGFYSPDQVVYIVYPNYGGGSGYTGGGSSGGVHYDSGLGYNVGARSAGYSGGGMSSGGYSGGSSAGSSGGGGAAAAGGGSSRGGDSGGGRGSSTGGHGR
jgi:hypothetical protein